MKKLFLIPLLACFFCIGTYADNVFKVASPDAFYEALETAESTKDSTQIILTADITGHSVFAVGANSHVLLNLNGHSLTSDFPGNEQQDIYQNCVVYNFGTLHIISEGDGIIQMPSKGGDAAVVGNEGTLVIDGGIFIGKYVVLMGWACIKAPTVWGATSSSNITVNGGTFLLPVDDAVKDGDYININGEDYYFFANFGNDPIYGSGTFHINGGVSAKSLSAKLDSNHEETTSTYTNALVDYTGQTVYIVHPKFTADADLTKSNSSTSVEVADNADVTLSAGEGGEEKEYAANFVYVEEGSKVTIETGATLVVEDKFVLEGENSQLEIQPGATLIVKNEVISANEASIALTVNDKEQVYSNLLVAAGKIQASHPKATVSYKTKCYRKGPGSYVWQRFAVPSYSTFNYSSMQKPTDMDIYVYGWDNGWVQLDNESILEPFQCYDMTVSAAEPGAEFTFECELMGNGNPALTIQANKWNLFANTYTAPMNLKAWLTDLMSTGAVDATIYIQKRQDLTDWQELAFGDVITGAIDDEYKQLYPMQAFIYYGRANTSIPLKYETYVYEPLMDKLAQAPARRVPSMYEDLQYATISVKSADNDEDLLTVYQSNDFSEAFDNGFDAMKKMNEEMFSTYFATPLGDLARLATNNLDSAAFSLKTLDATEFTMSFKNVALEGYAIVDTETKDKIEIKAGEEYAFTAEANTTYEDRFIIVEVGSHTAIDNVEATKKANGIYTLTGQYMGHDRNALPSGVYIFNGKKIVR